MRRVGQFRVTNSWRWDESCRLAIAESDQRPEKRYDWFRELVRVCNVMQCGAAKYVESIQGLGSRRLHALMPVVEEPVRFARKR